ncbi:MAG TPA: hypothetical protein VFV58_39305 [Blastocatellia bacterium]|jgi:hypothetical protein|nr:hypothetical protein [Blastocatellia bacterium]
MSGVNELTELERAHALTRALLSRVGNPSVCRGPNCKAEVYMVRHLNGVLGIYNPDGESHFVTCPDRELFRRPKR